MVTPVIVVLDEARDLCFEPWLTTTAVIRPLPFYLS